MAITYLNYDRRKRWLDLFARLASKPFPGLVRELCKWHAAFRSFRGHIRIQSATAGGRVDLGPAVQLEDGCYQANTRTLARAAGIEKLQATHRWVDIVDLRIFLMGFEWGEEYYYRNDRTQESTQISRDERGRPGIPNVCQSPKGPKA